MTKLTLIIALSLASITCGCGVAVAQNPYRDVMLSANFDLAKTAPHQIPEVRDALSKMWIGTSNGTTGAESSVVLHGLKSDGSPVMRIPPNSNEHNSETFSISPGDAVIFHVHPNKTNPRPSQADMAIARKYDISIYSLSNQGLYRYSKGDKSPVQVERNLSFLTPSKKGVQ